MEDFPENKRTEGHNRAESFLLILDKVLPTFRLLYIKGCVKVLDEIRFWVLRYCKMNLLHFIALNVSILIWVNKCYLCVKKPFSFIKKHPLLSNRNIKDHFRSFYLITIWCKSLDKFKDLSSWSWSRLHKNWK